MMTKTSRGNQNAPLYFQTHRSNFTSFLSYLMSSPPLLRQWLMLAWSFLWSYCFCLQVLGLQVWSTMPNNGHFLRVGGKCSYLQSHSTGSYWCLETVSLCCPGWLGTHYKAQDLGNSPASADQVLASISGISNHA